MAVVTGTNRLVIDHCQVTLPGPCPRDNWTMCCRAAANVAGRAFRAQRSNGRDMIQPATTPTPRHDGPATLVHFGAAHWDEVPG
jgi:hypothetical protein